MRFRENGVDFFCGQIKRVKLFYAARRRSTGNKKDIVQKLAIIDKQVDRAQFFGGPDNAMTGIESMAEDFESGTRGVFRDRDDAAAGLNEILKIAAQQRRDGLSGFIVPI